MINEKAKGLKQGAIRAMFDRANTMTGVISMGIGEPDMTTPALICEASDGALKKGLTHYTPNAGLPLLRQAIAGKSYLKDLGYDPNTEVIESLITPKTKALMINSPNNPTGSVTSRETLKKIAEVAKKHDLLIISDEVYNTLLYGDETSVTIASLPGMRERTIVVNSFSKAYAMTGWRVGYIAGPAHIIDRMTKCQENFNGSINAATQYAAVIALDHPELCVELKDIFAKRRDILLEEMAKIKGIGCNDPTGAFYAFADVSSFGLTSMEFCNRLLEEQKVVCIPGSAFGECGEGFIRICYTCGEDDLREAIARIARFCEGL